jgi:hypothetical protein
MLPLPRVLVIDDEKKHADAIADALCRAGVECVPAQYDGENPESLHPALRGIRILLSDLHLIPGSHTATITQICQPLIELITGGVPLGTPFVLVLWTAHPRELQDVRDHLKQRLAAGHQPLAVHALDKTEHLSGDNRIADADALAAALSSRLREMPAAAALLEWEEMLANSARSAVDELHRMVLEVRGGIDYSVALATVLARFAEHALGRSNAAQRPAAGLTEVLVPVIADALSLKTANVTEEIWRRTLQAAGTDAMTDIAGRMNGRLHIGGAMDYGVHVTSKEPGTVVEFPPPLVAEPQFSSRFGQTWADMRKSVMRNIPEIATLPCQMALVRLEPPCDHAQGKPGPMLFAFGVVISASDRKNGSIPEIWWESPPLRRSDIPVLANIDKLLLVNTRAIFIPFEAEFAAETILFRLRPPLASSLSYHYGTRLIRPGIISFR